MSQDEAMKFPEPKTIDEKLIWILIQMVRFSNIRLNHFRHLAKHTSEYIVKEIERNSITNRKYARNELSNEDSKM